jgi:hypothetical protein
MKIYLAARYSRRDEMAQKADWLKDKGYKITSRWVYGGEEGLSRKDIAILDYDDVIAADTIILFTEPKGSYNRGGGRHTEFGIAYEADKECFVVGEDEQVFVNLPGVVRFNSLEEFVSYDNRSLGN